MSHHSGCDRAHSPSSAALIATYAPVGSDDPLHPPRAAGAPRQAHAPFTCIASQRRCPQHVA
eukprot:10278389-Alexandrium_andersonii.AAC.1